MDDKSYDLNKLFEFFKYWKDYTHSTEFYNEGWLLKLLVYAITDFGLKEHPLYVNENEKFFSEGLLPSPFLTEGKKNPFAESHTHADGAIGNFTIGNNSSKGLLELKGNKLNIFEAKINSGFSTGVTNASFYNQAARNVACIAETIDKADKLENLDSLSIGFYLVVPKDQYEKKKSFEEFLDRDHILKTVKKRVDQYKNEGDYVERKDWFDTKFTLVLKHLERKPLFYEDVITELKGSVYIKKIKDFYNSCIEYN
ncbi:hypothetical protein SAMN06265371_10626 [Lutibacter agarilyticus]|uniref:Uncharacterized protein n=1 Tax=Lutibacter agarilyticus TaxID=1109740 RepID=A0A238XHG8_9FLAO|nr:hypothetical protein [Lutibacter agarilyticus]SNR58021.1 hypothetical protein SAMN06265371_10626 [Lutibacter agarilyticus]